MVVFTNEGVILRLKMYRFFLSQTPKIYLNKSKTRWICLAVTGGDLSHIGINFLLSAEDHQSIIEFDKDDFLNLCNVEDEILENIKKGKKTTTIMNRNGFKIVVKEMHKKRGLALTKNSGAEIRFLGQTLSNLMAMKRTLNNEYNELTEKIKVKADELIKLTKNEQKFIVKKQKVEKVIKRLHKIKCKFVRIKF